MMLSESRVRAPSRLLVAFAAVGCLASAQAAEDLKTGGPYVPTPQLVVNQMLLFAQLREQDFVIDLGSGDGIIVLTAAKQFKASGMGVEIDADLVRKSNESAQKLRVADRARFVQLDVFKADLSKATVLTLYLLPDMMVKLRSKLFNELEPGVRVVSHDYHFGNDWMPDDQISFTVPEKEYINGSPTATIYLWYVPARIAGKWEVKAAGGKTYEFTLKQRFQSVDGSVTSAGKQLRPPLISLRGSEFSLTLQDGSGVAHFTGRVKDDAMEGTVELPGAETPARWSAVRTAAGVVATD